MEETSAQNLFLSSDRPVFSIIFYVLQPHRPSFVDIMLVQQGALLWFLRTGNLFSFFYFVELDDDYAFSWDGGFVRFVPCNRQFTNKIKNKKFFWNKSSDKFSLEMRYLRFPSRKWSWHNVNSVHLSWLVSRNEMRNFYWSIISGHRMFFVMLIWSKFNNFCAGYGKFDKLSASVSCLQM